MSDTIVDDIDTDAWTSRHGNSAIGTDDDLWIDQIGGEIAPARRHVARKREARQGR